MPMYYFLQRDIQGLDEKIAELRIRIASAHSEYRSSKRDRHGDDEFESSPILAEDALLMWTKQLVELEEIRINAHEVHTIPDTDTVAFGKTVQYVELLENDTRSDTRTVTLGSFEVYYNPQNNIISYIAPLARAFMGAEPGDVRSALIAGKNRTYEILSIN